MATSRPASSSAGKYFSWHSLLPGSWRVAGLVLGVCALLYTASAATFYWAMRQPPERFGAIMAHVPGMAMSLLPFEPMWMSARAGSLQPGDIAPDFDLPTPDHSRHVRISEEYRTQPVVLIFGSYTWPPFRREVPELNRLYEKYKERASFYMVYIKEAHPIDLWQTRANLRDGVLVSSPRTEADRSSNASQCVRNLGIRLPALIDGINDNVERDYTGWPERLYIIVPGGRVVYKSKPGPFGFSPKAMEPYLRQALGLAAAPQPKPPSALKSVTS